MRLIIVLLMIFQSVSFKETQLRFVRVKSAFEKKQEVIVQYFTNKKIEPLGANIFIRAFKRERELEVWVRENGKSTFSLLMTYDFCASSGTLGPKRREGDLQIPEGVYHINHFNPKSNFHLSLGLNYPNASDKILSDKRNPGGSIYIHGNCVTIGCIPITDDKIKELYILAVEAKNNGQKKIPVHIFPTKLTDDNLAVLKNTFGSKHESFWKNLKIVYDDFEQTKELKPVQVNVQGAYHFSK